MEYPLIHSHQIAFVFRRVVFFTPSLTLLFLISVSFFHVARFCTVCLSVLNMHTLSYSQNEIARFEWAKMQPTKNTAQHSIQGERGMTYRR